MTAKIRQIIDQLKGLVTYKADKSMSDEDFIANVDAANFLCDLHDDLGLDRSEIRKNLDKLYPQFSRRVKTKEDIQLAIPLIKALERFIYDRTPDNADLGPAYRRKALVEMCEKVVAAYRENPLIHSTDYLYTLRMVTQSRDYVEQSEYKEINDIFASYLEDMDSAPVEERLRRLTAYKKSRSLLRPGNNDPQKWEDIKTSIYDVNADALDDETYVMWCDLTDRMPVKELARRSVHSNRMRVEYLHALAMQEFDRISREKTKRKLRSDMKTLNDELIGDIIPLKIDSGMSVSTLYALETIFYLRLQLAEVGWEDKEPIYYHLCRDRYEQIARVLMEKYANANSFDEKIEILERLESVGLELNSDLFVFAREEAAKFEDSSNITEFQRLRLYWINHRDEAQNISATIRNLLPKAKDSFDIATLAVVQEYGSYEDREAIFDRVCEIFRNALSLNDTAELGRLLAIIAYWNINPTMRENIKRLISLLGTQPSEIIPLPERRVNAIAAEVYTKIDKITGKYEISVNGIPA